MYRTMYDETIDTRLEETGLKEECGVFGIYDFDGNDVASTVYYLSLIHI